MAGPKSGLGLLALGSDQGHVSIWDLTRGVLACRLGEGQNLKRTTGLAFTADGTKLYSTAAGDAEVVAWDVKTGDCARRIAGDKHGATALVLDPAEGATLAVGRTRIHLVDAASGERRKKISSGHAAAVTRMAFSADGGFLATASEGARHVNIFDCRGKKNKEAVATLALDGVPTSLALRAEQGPAEQDDAIVFTVLACCDTGSIRVVRQTWSPSAAAATPATLKVVVGGAKEKENVGALAACFLPAGEGQGSLAWRCAVVYGAESGPAFETVTYASGAGLDQLLPKVRLGGGGEGEGEGEEKEAAEAGTKRKRKDVKAVEALDPASKKVAVDGSMGSAATRELATTPSGSRGGKEEAEEDEDGDAATLGRRLQAMAQGLELPTSAMTERKGPKADSLVTVMSQALKSGDEDLLEQCLSVHDTQTISNTVQLLPPPLTLALVETLVRKLEKRPNRAATLCPWVRLLLLHHTSYLVSVPDLHQRLAGLHQLATRRVAVLPRLLGLSGRLDLMLSQISKHGSGQVQKEKAPVDVYVDGESDEEEEEEEEEGGLVEGDSDSAQEEEEAEDEDSADESE